MLRDDKWYTYGLVIGMSLSLGRGAFISSRGATKAGLKLVGNHPWALPATFLITFGWLVKRWREAAREAYQREFVYQVALAAIEAQLRGYNYNLIAKWVNLGVKPELILFVMKNMSREQWAELVARTLATDEPFG